MKYLIAIAGLAVVSAQPAVAAPHEGGAFIKDYDTNHDGGVTKAEFDAVRAARFKATDADGDDRLSEDEYVGEYSARLESQLAASTLSEEKKTEERQRQIRQAHVRFGVLDRDKNARIEKAEYDASGARAFAEQDADKNGVITAADAAARAKTAR